MLPQTMTTNTSTQSGSDKKQKDIRPRWGRLISTSPEQSCAIPMESNLQDCYYVLSTLSFHRNFHLHRSFREGIQ